MVPDSSVREIMKMDEGAGGLSWLVQPPSKQEVILIRTNIDECNVIDITPDATVDDIIRSYFPGQASRATLHLIRYDALGKVIGSIPMKGTDLVAPFAQPRLDYTGNAEDDCDDKDFQSFKDGKGGLNVCCNLWLVEETVRIFFNPYIRMVLGLPMWYLDLPIDGRTCVRDLDILLREYLAISPTDDRFALHGNFPSHTSPLEGDVNVQALSRECDPQKNHFWQYMVRVDRENHANLGVSRQSFLWLRKKGYWFGSRLYWFALQGTTLYYRHEPPALTAIIKEGKPIKWKIIEHIDQCQIIYRGGRQGSKTFAFDIVTLEGERFRLHSTNKRRIEKWMRCLRAAHPSCEVNEPMTMELLQKMTLPQEHPLAIPSNTTESKQPTTNPGRFSTQLKGEDQKVDYDCLLADLETMLEAIDRHATDLLSRRRRPLVRRREAHKFVEQVRAFLIAIVKVNETDMEYFCNVIPEIKSLIFTLRNFQSVVEGRSDFVMTTNQITEYIEEAVESVAKLATFYRDRLQKGGLDFKDGGEEVNADVYEEQQQIIKKLRKSLKQPLSQIRLSGLRIRRASLSTSIMRQSTTQPDRGDNDVDDDGEMKGSNFFGFLNKSKKGHRNEGRKGQSHKSEEDDDDRGAHEKSKRQAKISEEEVQEMSISSSVGALEEQHCASEEHLMPKMLASDNTKEEISKRERFWRQKETEATVASSSMSNKERKGMRSRANSLLTWLGLTKVEQMNRKSATVSSRGPEDNSVADDEFDEKTVGRGFNSPLSVISPPRKEDERYTRSKSTGPFVPDKNFPPPPPPPPSIDCTTPLRRPFPRHTDLNADAPRVTSTALRNEAGFDSPPEKLQCESQAESQRVHRRRHSLYPTAASNTIPEADYNHKPAPSAHGHGRRKSIVEIDQTLLNVLLRDPRLSKLICPTDEGAMTNCINAQAPPLPSSEVEGNNLKVADVPAPTKLRHLHQRSQSLRPKPSIEASRPIKTLHSARPLTCDICRLAINATIMVNEEDEIVCTAFARFHRRCLTCADCGIPLSTQSFRLEGGKAKCRQDCTITPSTNITMCPEKKVSKEESPSPNSPLSQSTELPRPMPKSILKKPTMVTFTENYNNHL